MGFILFNQFGGFSTVSDWPTLKKYSCEFGSDVLSCLCNQVVVSKNFVYMIGFGITLGATVSNKDG